MKFKHINYEGGTGKRSKEVETYNYHKAAAVLAEYGFDCIRLADDWQGADFLAHHKRANQILKVQLKSCLVIDKKYKHEEELYMCFPLDKNGQMVLGQAFPPHGGRKGPWLAEKEYMEDEGPLLDLDWNGRSEEGAGGVRVRSMSWLPWLPGMYSPEQREAHRRQVTTTVFSDQWA